MILDMAFMLCNIIYVAKNKNNSLRTKIVITGIILLLLGVVFAISEVQKQQNIRQEAYGGKPRPQITPTTYPCGGIAGIKCSTGYTCVLDGTGTDGKCVKDAVVCPKDVKQCPDGSYVGRTGPKCGFAPCPITTTPITTPIKKW